MNKKQQTFLQLKEFLIEHADEIQKLAPQHHKELCFFLRLFEKPRHTFTIANESIILYLEAFQL